MQSNNRGMTIIIIVAVIIILGVRFFLSNRESITEDDVRDKVNAAVNATQTASNPNRVPVEITSAADVLRISPTVDYLGGTMQAQATHISELLATNDAQSNLTPILAPTLTPTPPSAVGAIRAENTAQALQMTVDAQQEQIANLQATNEAFVENVTPTRTPIPTMVDMPEPVTLSIDNDSNLLSGLGEPTLINVAPNGEKIILRVTNAVMLIFDLNTADMVTYAAENLGEAHVTAWSPDSSQVAVGNENGHVLIWDVATAEIIHEIDVSGAVLEIAWSPNGNLFAIQTSENLTLFYTNTWSEMIAYQMMDGRNFAWSPDSENIVYADGHIVYVVAMDDLYSKSVLGGFNQALQLVTWSPDGQFLALVDASDEHRIYLQVWPEKNILYAVSGGANVNSLAWSPDSRYFMTDGSQAKIWEVASGNLRYILDSRTPIHDAQWLPNTTFIVLLAENMVLWPNPVNEAEATSP